MIAKKIESVIRRLYKLEYLVGEDAWKVIVLAMNELKDAAASAQALETGQAMKPAGLTVIDIFAEPDATGRLRVNPVSVAEILGDIAEAMRDVAAAGPGPQPIFTAVPAPEAGQ